jgi:Gluconate 2-dehydrogenase subunit 3
MSAADLPHPSRRHVLTGGIATIAALMLDFPAQTLAIEALAHRKDPRMPLADRISDLVIPDTDTPGASRARVADFVLLGFDHKLGPLEPVLFDRVRGALDGAAGGQFLRQLRARQFALLADLDRRSYAGTPTKGSPESAWPLFKTAILAGYYTSEIGASKELVFDAVPGSRENFTLTDKFRMPSNLTIAASL